MVLSAGPGQLSGSASGWGGKIDHNEKNLGLRWGGSVRMRWKMSLRVSFFLKKETFIPITENFCPHFFLSCYRAHSHIRSGSHAHASTHKYRDME